MSVAWWSALSQVGEGHRDKRQDRRVPAMRALPFAAALAALVELAKTLALVQTVA